MRFLSTPGAFFNSVFLLALALSIFLQSIERFIHIAPVDSPLMMMVIGCVGLGLNILSAFFAHGKCRNATIFNSPDHPWPQSIMVMVMAMVIAIAIVIAIVCTVIVMSMSAIYIPSN